LNRPDAAFGQDTNVVSIYDAKSRVYESAAPESKRLIARRLMEISAALLSRS